jgi:hypothetical protein
MSANDIDYANTGLTLREAMVAHAKRYPDKKNRPDTILWGKFRVKTFDWVPVPYEGTVRLEFLSYSQIVRQGVDVHVDGWLQLARGEQVPHLRTWLDNRFEDVVEYPFFSKDGFLRTWNVYEMTYPNGQKIEEKWTGNAGFWVEVNSNNDRIYHCSHGMASPPDFTS